MNYIFSKYFLKKFLKLNLTKKLKKTKMLEDTKYLENLNDFPKIGLIFYENSGENLLRFYLEQIFKIKTGSNIKTLHNNIFKTNQNQENTENNWILASDFPLRNKDEYFPTYISCAIILVRNPIDLIMSKILKETFTFEEAMAKIDLLIDEWKEFYKYWIDSPIPVHIVRYEDLLYEPVEILTEICKFLLGIKNLNNTKLDFAIKNVCEMQIENIYFAYDVEIGSTLNNNAKNNKFFFLNKDNIILIQKKFSDRLIRVLSLFKYQLNDDYDTKNWLVDTNKENLVKSVEFHELLINQFMTSNYFALKIA